jgi:ABC-type multidrug transport system fused ATPase/permease subunit
LFVIEDGRLTESGSHGELMANPASTYRRLVELQREVQHAI